MNKKGIFFSITALLIIMLISMFFSNREIVLDKEKDNRVERLKTKVIENFASDFKDDYSYLILSTSARYSLRNRTKDNSSKFTKYELEEIMKNGNYLGQDYVSNAYTTTSVFNYSLSALSFKMENTDFDFSIIKVEQKSYDKLTILFHYNYSFTSSGIRLYNDGLNLSMEISLNSLYHPAYGMVIDDSWTENSTGGCYVQEIMTDAEDCSGLDIMPVE